MKKFWKRNIPAFNAGRYLYDFVLELKLEFATLKNQVRACDKLVTERYANEGNIFSVVSKNKQKDINWYTGLQKAKTQLT